MWERRAVGAPTPVSVRTCAIAAGILLGACSTAPSVPTVPVGPLGGNTAPTGQAGGGQNAIANSAGGNKANPGTSGSSASGSTGSSGSGATGATQGGAGTQAQGAAAAGGGGSMAAGSGGGVGAMMPGPALAGMCPTGFAKPKMGENVGFPHDNVMRQFMVFLPEDMSTPRPVFVALTGTVESTQAFTVTNSGLSELTQKGWVVLAPVRACSSDAMDSSQSCNGVGTNGWGWRPWNEGSSSPMWKQEVGPDGNFLKSMVRCAATEWKLDETRLFVGGISSGGTFSNRLLTFMDDFWAGGIPASGEWYIENGMGLSGDTTMMNNPMAIPTGRCCPQPLKEKLQPMLVITLWGGESDMWMGLSNYRPSTQASSNYFSSKPEVVEVSCSGTHGHFWPRGMTGRTFNTWAADLLYGHPKGSDPKNFKLTTAPPEFKCQLGRYTDHYGK